MPKLRTIVYAARNAFRDAFGKFVDPKNVADLDVIAGLWFEGALAAFSFAEGSVVLHEVAA